jgi:Integrase core domain
MELWQLDVMEARLKGGSAVKILTGLDDHSRFCVVARAMSRATARPVCEAFAQALRAYGVPQAVLTDIQAEWCPSDAWFDRPAGQGSMGPAPWPAAGFALAGPLPPHEVSVPTKERLWAHYE